MDERVLALYAARWIHILVAVFGIGQITAIAALARAVRIAPNEGGANLLRGLLTVFSWSLLIALLTGIAMALLVGPPFERTIWFRTSFLLAIVVGALAGMTRRALKRSAAVRAERLVWGMLGVVALMVTLMVLKP
jgi:hypothetical protein